MTETIIKWDRLSETQKYAFLFILERGLRVLESPLIMRFLLNREGAFNKGCEAGVPRVRERVVADERSEESRLLVVGGGVRAGE